jgi:Flp pilus assembly protein TadB
MSRQRALRRAARQAEVERAQAARNRRARRRATLKRLRPRLPDKRTGRLYPRRTRAQRAGIAVVAAVALAFIWLYVDSLPTRVALTALVVVASPVVIVLTLDRRI